MSNTKVTINSQQSLSKLIGELRELFKETKYFQVTISMGKARSLSQNAILHAWCHQVSVEEAEFTTADVKCLVKYNIFMPIQRGVDPEFNDVCETVIDPLSYSDRIKAMAILPVTSRMKIKELSQGLEAMQAYYLGRVDLQFPDE